MEHLAIPLVQQTHIITSSHPHQYLEEHLPTQTLCLVANQILEALQYLVVLLLKEIPFLAVQAKVLVRLLALHRILKHLEDFLLKVSFLFVIVFINLKLERLTAKNSTAYRWN